MVESKEVFALKESEKILEPKLAREVKKVGGWALKLPATFVSGLPDRLVLMPGGRAYFVEMKTTGEKPRKIQLAIHRKLRSMGFDVFVIDSTKGINEFIRRATT